VRWLKSEDASSRKLEHRVRGIRGMYKVLVEENIVNTNPAEDYFPSEFLDSTNRGNAQNERTIAENRQGPHANFDTITPEEFEKLLENVEAPRFRNQLICKMMWQLMLRSEQITMIEIGDESNSRFPLHIDSENNRVDLQDNKKDVEADDYWYEGYFKDDVKFMLRKWIEDKRRQLGPSMAESSDYLFITHQKEQMRPEHISRIIKTAAKNAGIQEKMYEDSEGRTRWKVTSHTLRRSAATYLANKTDYPLHMLASDLNHRSVETTRDRYVRENNEERKKRRQEISEL
jgi:integrase/recombinase XerD